MNAAELPLPKKGATCCFLCYGSVWNIGFEFCLSLEIAIPLIACEFEPPLSEAFARINLWERGFHFSKWKPLQRLVDTGFVSHKSFLPLIFASFVNKSYHPISFQGFELSHKFGKLSPPTTLDSFHFIYYTHIEPLCQIRESSQLWLWANTFTALYIFRQRLTFAPFFQSNIATTAAISLIGNRQIIAIANRLHIKYWYRMAEVPPTVLESDEGFFFVAFSNSQAPATCREYHC